MMEDEQRNHDLADSWPGVDDEEQDPEDAREDEREAEGRRLYNEHVESVRRLIAVLPAPVEEHVVFDASDPGVKLIDVIEATVEVGGKFGGGLSARDAYVRLPHGYASVEFLRMLFAVSG